MLLDDATMQVSFLKDLVTLRNPASDYSFVSYLHERGRLIDFINHKILFPLRIEFHDYLEWAAARVDHLVDLRPARWSTSARSSTTARSSPSTSQRGRRRSPHGAPGPQRGGGRRAGTAACPPASPSAPGSGTTSTCCPGSRPCPADPEPRRFVVVGAGQSAAEAVDFLHRRFPTAEVCSVFARCGYTPADDTPFANRIFDPDAVDMYFDADDDVKRMLFDYHRNTNYSVVDADLINELYRREYQERVQGRRRLRMLNASQVVGHRRPRRRRRRSRSSSCRPASARRCTPTPSSTPPATGRPTRAGCWVEAGGLVERPARRRARGRPRLPARPRPAGRGRACTCRAAPSTPTASRSTLLSNIAVRTGEIVESVAARRAAPALPRPVGAAAG